MQDQFPVMRDAGPEHGPHPTRRKPGREGKSGRIAMCPARNRKRASMPFPRLESAWHTLGGGRNDARHHDRHLGTAPFRRRRRTSADIWRVRRKITSPNSMGFADRRTMATIAQSVAAVATALASIRKWMTRPTLETVDCCDYLVEIASASGLRTCSMRCSWASSSQSPRSSLSVCS